MGEAVEHYVTEYDSWKREIERRRDVPREKRRYVGREEGRAWINSLGTDNPMPLPKGTARPNLWGYTGLTRRMPTLRLSMRT